MPHARLCSALLGGAAKRTRKRGADSCAIDRYAVTGQTHLEMAQVRAVDEAERRGREPLEVPAITAVGNMLHCVVRTGQVGVGTAKWERACA